MDERVAQLEGMVQRLALDLQTTAQRVQAEQQSQQATLAALQTERERTTALENELRTRRSSGHSNPLASRKGFEKVLTFGGAPAKFDNWKFKFVAFAGQEEGLVSFLQWAEDETTEITEQNILDEGQILQVDGAKLNRELYQALALVLRDSALALIKNYSPYPQSNGANSWRKLVEYYAGATAQRVQGLAARVYNPPRCKNYRELVSAVEAWENVVRQFEKAEKQRLGEQS
eukprot:3230667-Amphidinium_carterae.1